MIKGRVITGLIVIAGLINFAPVIGVMSADRIESLYGIELNDPVLEVLLRHRAVLFGLLGGFMIIAAFKPQWHRGAIVGGFLAMLSFLALYLLGGSQPASLLSIVYADVVGVVALSIAVVMKLLDRRNKGFH